MVIPSDLKSLIFVRLPVTEVKVSLLFKKKISGMLTTNFKHFYMKIKVNNTTVRVRSRYKNLIHYTYKNAIAQVKIGEVMETRKI